MGMNTTKLIEQWSMAGAVDFDGSFGPLAAEQGPARHEEPTPGAAGELLLKRAGEEEWQPLSLGSDPV
jgi:hypothetical protein